MSERPPDLPEFERPPVTEVVLGVQFKTEKPLRVPHVGLFWQTIREAFPEFVEHPPLGPQIEQLPADPFHAPPGALEMGIQIGMGAFPTPRCWFVDNPGNKVIQLQTDRFLHNWRKISGEEEYPRYETIRDEFIDRWRQFVSFSNDEKLGAPTVTQAEVTYVNHIPQDSCWSEADDMPNVFSCLKLVDEIDLFGPMETMEFNIRRRLRDNRGRLYVKAAPAFTTKDKSVILRMVLTTRGPVADNSDEAILDWMDMGRSTIVKGFAALTAPAAHKVWGRIE